MAAILSTSYRPCKIRLSLLNLTGNGIQKQTGNGNYTYNPRGNLGSLADNQIQQSDQFEINTDIGQVEKRRVRFNPNLEGHLIAFENVNEK